MIWHCWLGDRKGIQSVTHVSLISKVSVSEEVERKKLKRTEEFAWKTELMVDNNTGCITRYVLQLGKISPDVNVLDNGTKMFTVD